MCSKSLLQSGISFDRNRLQRRAQMAKRFLFLKYACANLWVHVRVQTSVRPNFGEPHPKLQRVIGLAGSLNTVNSPFFYHRFTASQKIQSQSHIAMKWPTRSRVGLCHFVGFGSNQNWTAAAQLLPTLRINAASAHPFIEGSRLRGCGQFVAQRFV